MGLIFDKINAEVAAREQIAAQAKSLEAARLARAGKARLEVSRDEMNARAAVAAKTRSIRAIRCQAATALGVLPSFDLYVPRLDADFRVEFHRPNSGPGRAFINAKGCHQTYLRATNLSTNKVHVWNGARKERVQCPNMPTGVYTAKVIGTDANGDPIFEIEENPLGAALGHFRHAALLGITEEPATDAVKEFGNTTTVVYPDAGDSTGGSVDGSLSGGGVGVYDWATVVDQATAYAAYPTTTGYHLAGWRAHTTTDKFRYLYRSVANFDTSAIGSDLVSAATISVYEYQPATDPEGNLPVVHCVSFTGNTDTLVKADYAKANFGTASLGSIAFSAVSNNQYNDITLNATGMSHINGSGITKFGFRTQFDINEVAPTWGAGEAYNTMVVRFADEAGTTSDPKLTIEHAAAAPASGGMSEAMKMILDL